MGSTVQKEEAAPTGRMIPVTTSTWSAAASRDPTCRPRLAAVAVVTATGNAAGDPWAGARVGREPATSVALRLSPLRYRISSWGVPRRPADGPEAPETAPALMARPDHCDAAGASGRPSRCRLPERRRPARARSAAPTWPWFRPERLASPSTAVCCEGAAWKIRCTTWVR
jgi:hypothetical protein